MQDSAHRSLGERCFVTLLEVEDKVEVVEVTSENPAKTQAMLKMKEVRWKKYE